MSKGKAKKDEFVVLMVKHDDYDPIKSLPKMIVVQTDDGRKASKMAFDLLKKHKSDATKGQLGNYLTNQLEPMVWRAVKAAFMKSADILDGTK